MDTRLKYNKIIKDILSEYAKYKPAYGENDSRLTFDDQNGAYALFQLGWDGDEYVHGAIVHIDLIEDKIWIQYDGTEEGVAEDLLKAGVPKSSIVLGFRPAELRKHTGFAVGGRRRPGNNARIGLKRRISSDGADGSTNSKNIMF